MPESPSKLSSYFHITSYTNQKPNSRKGEGWAGLCYPAHQFLFFIQDPFIQNSKKKSPAQLSPSTSYLSIIWSATTPNGSFSFTLFSLFFLSLLFSLFSFFLPPLLLLFLPHRCFYTKHIFCSQRVVFLYIWRPNPPDR